MLPEFLLTVENSMHEIARDDFNLLNGVQDCDKDLCPCSSNGHIRQTHTQASPLDRSPLTSTLSSTAASTVAPKEIGATSAPYEPIKLEDSQSCDLFSATKWHQSGAIVNGHPQQQHHHSHHRLGHTHSGHHQQSLMHRKSDSKLLLQSSEDPMICHGAATDDDHPAAEFKSLMASSVVGSSKHQHQQQQQQHRHASQQEQRLDSPPIVLATMPTTTQAKQKTSLESVGLQVKRLPQNGCSSLTKQQLKMKAGLMSNAAAAAAAAAANQQNNSFSTTIHNGGSGSGGGGGGAASRAKPMRSPQKTKKKGAIKLRFHHQALPPEYLSHYEATQGHLATARLAARKDTAGKGTKEMPASQVASSSASVSMKLSQTVKLPPPKSAHENVRSWLQKIAEIQRTAQQQQQQKSTESGLEIGRTGQQQGPLLASEHDLNNNNQLSRMQATQGPPIEMSTPESTFLHGSLQQQQKEQQKTAQPTHPVKRVVNYSDLPYMGEITLNNCKPRRGRKPKKTDICHLIYKNYGTIFPGTPKNAFAAAQGSLVGKLKLDDQAGGIAAVCPNDHHEEQPLNLCLRDQTIADFYSLSSDADDDDDDDGRLSATSLSNCTTPPATPSDCITDTLLAANMRNSIPSSLGAGETVAATIPGRHTTNGDVATTQATQPAMSLSSSPSSTSHLLLHPMSVYYQKLIQSGTYEMIHKDNQLALKIPIPSGLFVTPKLEKTSPLPFAAKNCTSQNNNNLEYPEPMSTPSSIKSEASNGTSVTATTNSTSAMAAASANGHQPAAPQKRKRSAIFIPPIPEENTTIPATEVSICKFKFTGGAKPTLQEKKMLSVDSDGNYRYYSGTGDKATRGYEFFPRESLQQSAGLIPGMNSAPSAHTYHCIGPPEKHAADIPPPSAGLSDELLQIPDSMASSLLLAATPPSGPFAGSAHQPAAQFPSERKKKSRRSMQREKLEKTFKERGFLIQTQQLESAEGATYCKFRQLKKFTRYLFRNWKDYLPGDMQQANVAAAAAAAAAAALRKYHDNGEPPQPQEAFESILSSHAFASNQQPQPTDTPHAAPPTGSDAAKNAA